METKRLIETENSIQEFTVQFYGGTVMIEQNQLPLGQISCELLDYPVEELLALHDEAVRLFSIVRDSLFARDKEKSPALAAAVQRQLNRALKHVYPLPLFSLLNIDRDTYGTMLEELCRSAPEEFQKAVTPGTPENEALSSFFGKLFRLPDELLCFRSYVSTMLDFYFEPLRRRNAEHYAVGVYRFFSDAAVQEALRAALPPYPTFEFLQSRPAMTEYVTMPDPVHPEKYILAERVVFSSLADFLHMDLFRGLMHGNVPRRCHNCRKFFLLQNGYDVRYCTRIAPGETKRTCRQVGAHNKQTDRDSKTPVQIEYENTYNRLKKRKARGKISTDEWNALVAKAQEIREQAQRGFFSDFEMKRAFFLDYYLTYVSTFSLRVDIISAYRYNVYR